MNTDDIIKSLNLAAVSKRGIPNELLRAIDAALVERDEAIALLSRIAAEVTRTAALGGYAYEIDGILVGEIDAVLRINTTTLDSGV